MFEPDFTNKLIKTRDGSGNVVYAVEGTSLLGQNSNGRHLLDAIGSGRGTVTCPIQCCDDGQPAEMATPETGGMNFPLDAVFVGGPLQGEEWSANDPVRHAIYRCVGCGDMSMVSRNTNKDQWVCIYSIMDERLALMLSKGDLEKIRWAVTPQ